MLIIDTHCHAGMSWFEPVESLLFQMDRHGVAHAVLVQHDGIYDGSYLLECARRHENRFKVVVMLDPKDPSKMKSLEGWHKKGAAGLRLFLKYGWDAKDPLWALAGELGMIVSVIGKTEDIESASFKKLLDNCPKTRFCVEHLALSGKAGSRFCSPPHDGYKSVLEIAQWPTTTIKVPGFGEILPRPKLLPPNYPFENLPPLFDMAKEAFGAKRMMWGSDYPPVAYREGYGNALEGVRKYPGFQTGDDLEWIMGKSAARLWGFA